MKYRVTTMVTLPSEGLSMSIEDWLKASEAHCVEVEADGVYFEGSGDIAFYKIVSGVRHAYVRGFAAGRWIEFEAENEK